LGILEETVFMSVEQHLAYDGEPAGLGLVPSRTTAKLIIIFYVAVVKPVAFPADDQKILEYWRKIDAFQTGQKLSRERLEKGEGKGEYRFYDGPPFATGLPHYGHLLMGTIKVGLPDS
jgi:hypothetical protein